MTRRTDEQVTAARELRDDLLRLIEVEPRSEEQLIRLTGVSKGQVKAALNRLVRADLVFAKNMGYRQERMWCHWPTAITELRAKRDANPVKRSGEVVRATGMRIA